MTSSRKKIQHLKGNWIITITLLMIFLMTHSEGCGFGCLRCDDIKFKCLLCDFGSFFFFDFEFQICRQNILTNCKLAFIDSNCLLCNNNYYPNDQGICVVNDNKTVINKCDLYYGKNKCAKCEKGYYLAEKSTLCIQADNTEDPKCRVFASDECEVCEEGYWYDRTENACVGKLSLSVELVK